MDVDDNNNNDDNGGGDERMVQGGDRMGLLVRAHSDNQRGGDAGML